ncbi:MAG: hypothetical protein ACO398_07445, partial [Kiritimatiellia bacterium]
RWRAAVEDEPELAWVRSPAALVEPGPCARYSKRMLSSAPPVMTFDATQIVEAAVWNPDGNFDRDGFVDEGFGRNQRWC